MYSLSWLKKEMEELRRDRSAFARALDALTNRIVESNETDIPRSPLLHEWSGARASVGSLEMAIHAIERTIEEVGQLILGIENGQIANIDITKKEPMRDN